METPVVALIILFVCVTGLYGGIFTMSKNEKLSDVFLEQRLSMGASLILLLGSMFIWFAIKNKTKDKREAKKCGMTVEEYLKWKETTLKTLKRDLETKGCLSYENLLEAFNNEKEKLIS